MKNKKIIALSVAAMTLTSGLVGYSVYEWNDKKKIFAEDGYILEGKSENKNKDEVQHFTKGSKFTERWSEKVEFKNTEGEKVAVEKDNFIHYNNKDISAISKGVLIDTNTLGDQKATSYGTPEFAEAKKTNDGYTINNLEENIQISDYIWKLSDGKYILVSDEINLELGQGKVETVSDYVELTYVDDGIVRLSNDSYTYQTVASSAKVKLANDVEVDLNNKDVLVDNEVKTSLTKMVVDSEDNVEIVQNKNDKNNKDNAENGNKADGTEGQNGNPGENNNNNTTNNNSGGQNTGENSLSGILEGLLGNNNQNNGATNGSEGVIVQFVDPTFDFSKFEISSIGFNADVNVTDEQKVLRGQINVQIYEKSTNKLIYTQNEAEGALEFSINIGNLKPNSDYILKINSEYEFNGKIYEKSFVNKQFKTNAMGLTYEKYSSTEDSITVSVNTKEDSKVNTGELVLYRKDNGEEVERIKLDLETAKDKQVKFEGLEINTEYVVKFENVLYNNTVALKEYDDGIKIFTLKGAPIIGTPVVKLDKKNMNFKLSLNKLEDRYNGVKSLTYQIFDVSDLENPVYQVSRNSLSEVDVPVDNVKIFKGTNYVFNVVVNYYDNEKMVEYESIFTEAFTMDGAQLAKIKGFRAEDIKFDKIKGDVIIEDPENTIPDDAMVSWTLSDHSGFGDVHKGETAVVKSGDEIYVEIDKNDLRANQSYELALTADVDLADGTGVKKIPLGSIVVKTDKAKALKVVADKNELSSENRINFNLQLINGDENGVKRNSGGATTPNESYEATTLTEMKLKLYSGNKNNKAYIGEVILRDENADPYISTLKAQYYDTKAKITDDIFASIAPNLDKDEYVIEVAELYDYTTGKNRIPITGERFFEVKANKKPPTRQELLDALSVQAITEANDGNNLPEIHSNTVVKVALNTNFQSKATLTSLKYNVYADNGNGRKTLIGEIDCSENGEVNPNKVINMTAGTNKTIAADIKDMQASFRSKNYELRRGNKYYFSYEAGFDLNGDKTEDYKVVPQATTKTGNTVDEVVIDGWRDKEQTINKQNLKISMYPTNIVHENGGYKWNYNISYEDLDNALVDNKLEIKHGSNANERSEVTIGQSQSTLTVASLKPGKQRVVGDTKLNKTQTRNTADDVVFAEYYFGGLTDVKSNNQSFIDGGVNTRFKYTVTPIDTTAFRIKVEGTENGDVNKITKLEVSLRSTANKSYKFRREYTLDRKGEVVVPLSHLNKTDLDKIKGQEVKVEVKAKYDTGNINLSERNASSALLQLNDPNNNGKYLKYSEGRGLQAASASGATVTGLNINSTDLTFNEANGRRYQYTHDKGSLYVSNIEGNSGRSRVLVKEEKANFTPIKDKENSANKVTIPNSIPPNAELITGDTVTTINSISFRYRIDTASTDKIQDYTVELYEGAELIGSKKFDNQSSTTVIDQEVTFGGETDDNMLEDNSNGGNKHKLKPDTRYNVKIKANLVGGTTTTTLKDSETGEDFNREFRTLGNIEINNIRYSVVNDEKNSKKLRINHDLSAVSILSKINYKLISNNKVVEITKDKVLDTNMEVDFDLGDGFVLGQEYTIQITPYAKSGSDQVELRTQQKVFKTYNLSLPYTSMRYETSVLQAENKASAKMVITINDKDAVLENIKGINLDIVDDKGNVYEEDTHYKRNIITDPLDENYIQIELIFDEVPLSTKLNVNLTAKCDTIADKSYDEDFKATFSMKTASSSGVSMGDVSVIAINNKLGVAFKDSVGLVSDENDKGAKSVQYTIYGKNGEIIKNYKGNFAPTSYPDENLYILSLDQQLSGQKEYKVVLSLFDHENNIIDTYQGSYFHGFTPKPSSFVSKIKELFKRN